MKIEALTQCDAGSGFQRKALFPGQRYELPDDVAKALIDGGKVRVVAGVATVRATGRAKA